MTMWFEAVKQHMIQATVQVGETTNCIAATKQKTAPFIHIFRTSLEELIATTSKHGQHIKTMETVVLKGTSAETAVRDKFMEELAAANSTVGLEEGPSLVYFQIMTGQRKPEPPPPAPPPVEPPRGDGNVAEAETETAAVPAAASSAAPAEASVAAAAKRTPIRKSASDAAEPAKKKQNKSGNR